MPHVSAREFERLPLRVHEFLHGVPLHDVWAVDLPHTRAGITLDSESSLHAVPDGSHATQYPFLHWTDFRLR